MVDNENAEQVAAQLGLPCVLKKPDSSFSAGVVKADTAEELAAHLRRFLQESELVIAQEFAKSEFDWRVGVLDRKALYACRYHMARGHWQIQKATSDKERLYGKTETLAVSDAKLTLTSFIPPSFRKPRSIFAAQLAQVIPVTDS